MTGSAFTPVGPYLSALFCSCGPSWTLIDASFATVSQSVSLTSKSKPETLAKRSRASAVHVNGAHARPGMANHTAAGNTILNSKVLPNEPTVGMPARLRSDQIIKCAALSEVEAGCYELRRSWIEAMWLVGFGIIGIEMFKSLSYAQRLIKSETRLLRE